MMKLQNYQVRFHEPSPDVVQLTKLVLEQNKMILEVNCRILESLSTSI